MSGIVLESYELVKELIENTTTKTVLTVVANILRGVYETGKKASSDIYEIGTIIFDKVLGNLNYKVLPAP